MKMLAAFIASFVLFLFTAGPAIAGTVTVKVKGMTCRLCEGAVKRSLETAKGVRSAKVSFTEGRAVVQYNDNETSPEEFLKTLEKTGYRGAVVNKK